MAATITRFLRRLSQCSSKNVIGLCYRNYTCTNIVSLLKERPFGQQSSVKGWVGGIRKHKDITFFHLTDGSGPHQLQVVLPESISRTLVVTYGSCVHVEGVIIESKGKGQDLEMLSTKVEVIGSCDSTEFPFKQKHRHPPQYARDFLHLRPKTNIFSALLRIRNAASMAVHQYFQKEDYIFIHTPILTSSDCEGACEVFHVQTSVPLSASDGEWEEDISAPQGLHSGQETDSKNCDTDNSPGHFFRCPTYLTVSGQLHLEVMTGAMKKVYNFGPTFRAENSGGSFHLSEFYMVEAELAFTESLEDILKVMEDLVRYVYKYVMESCPEDVDLFTKYVAPSGFQKSVEKMTQAEFKRISYTDAVDMLLKSNQNFQYEVSWGSNLMKEHELYLTQALGNVPVFVTDYPAAIKPFYAKKNPDSQTVAASDLLVPHVGELCGSSLREDRLDVLSQVMESHGLDHQMSWYMDLRRFGSCPHGGFGLGFERLLLFMLGAHGIKDVIPFPRWPGRCHL